MKRNVCLLLIFFALRATAGGVGDSISSDPVVPRKTYFWNRGVIGKVVEYFEKADDVKPLDKFDISFIGGPDINSTTGIGIGLCGSGLYHLCPSDTTLQQSSITITGEATHKGMFSANIKNDNFFPRDRFRSHAELKLTTFRNQFWGFGYVQNDNDANESLFTQNEIEFKGYFAFRMAQNLYMGPALYYDFRSADRCDDLSQQLLSGVRRRESVAAVGVTLSYDTRDLIHDAHRGMYVNLEQRVSPSVFNTGGTFTTTDFQLCGYQPIWRGCVLAGELHTKINCGNRIPWSQFGLVGSNERMRGYYQGRYRDRNIVEAQLEFRQHLWKRFGMVWWVAAANVFQDQHTWKLNQTLPNYGLGLRWRFKPGVNVRIDYGFTRNGSGLVFCVNEAF